MDRRGSYELGELLGEGSFSRAYRARHVETGMVRAVKVGKPASDVGRGATLTGRVPTGVFAWATGDLIDVKADTKRAPSQPAWAGPGSQSSSPPACAAYYPWHDPREDLLAFGLILWELLLGLHPLRRLPPAGTEIKPTDPAAGNAAQSDALAPELGEPCASPAGL